MSEKPTLSIWCAYLTVSPHARVPDLDRGELPAVAGRTSMLVRTRRRTELYGRGNVPPSLRDLHARGSVGLLTGTGESLHRLTRIAAGLDSPLLGDPGITDQLSDRYRALAAPHPLRATLAQALAVSHRLRSAHGLAHVRGYPHLALDVLIHDDSPAGRCLVVRGAGRLGRATAAAGIEAGYDRVFLLTRSPRRARTALLAGPYAAVIEIRVPGTDLVPETGWDLIVATDDIEHRTTTTVPGYRRVVDLSTPANRPEPDTDTVHTLHGPALSARIGAHNGCLAHRGARARLELARWSAGLTTTAPET